jgi:hypothetical protein
MQSLRQDAGKPEGCSPNFPPSIALDLRVGEACEDLARSARCRLRSIRARLIYARTRAGESAT